VAAHCQRCESTFLALHHHSCCSTIVCTTLAELSPDPPFGRLSKTEKIPCHRHDTSRGYGELFRGASIDYIGIEDSEAVLRAIRLTPDEQPIDVILHTPGGLVLAAEQIARALVDHKGKVTVFVPHYAMSGGTLIALAANEIVMDPNAVLGPVDPQIGGLPAASILKAVELKKPLQVSDEVLILADMAAKARIEVASFLLEILQKRLPKDQATNLAAALTEGSVTHDFPLTVDILRNVGLSISTAMPRNVYELMDLYPQAGANRPSVLYVPMRRGPATRGDNPSAP
jgi:ClpP class serine protease